MWKMNNPYKVKSPEILKEIAAKIRVHIVRSLTEAGSGHLGGSLGLADIFTYLYFNVMTYNPNKPEWKGRDRLILSIGHVAPVLYATLSEAGFFDDSELLTLRKLGSRLQGHPGKDKGLPGIEVSSGSLGQGLSIGVGLALSYKYDKMANKTFVIMGDGELQEGSVWEAAMSAAHYKLDNLIAIVDRNNKQIDGDTSDVMNIEPLQKKWEAFGWHVLTCNGNDFKSIHSTFKKLHKVSQKPHLIIANTYMGKGIRSIENDYRWHGKVPSKEQAENFIKELTLTNSKTSEN